MLFEEHVMKMVMAFFNSWGRGSQDASLALTASLD
jgi:hypothetical protein